jgi:hypothetical protein
MSRGRVVVPEITEGHQGAAQGDLETTASPASETHRPGPPTVPGQQAIPGLGDAPTAGCDTDVAVRGRPQLSLIRVRLFQGDDSVCADPSFTTVRRRGIRPWSFLSGPHGSLTRTGSFGLSAALPVRGHSDGQKCK